MLPRSASLLGFLGALSAAPRDSVAQQPRFATQSWVVIAPAPTPLPTPPWTWSPPSHAASGSATRLKRAAIGGVLGALAGVATCTLLSNLFFNEGSGTSSCTTKGNLYFAGGGFLLGGVIGWAWRSDQPAQ